MSKKWGKYSSHTLRYCPKCKHDTKYGYIAFGDSLGYNGNSYLPLEWSINKKGRWNLLQGDGENVPQKPKHKSGRYPLSKQREYTGTPRYFRQRGDRSNLRPAFLHQGKPQEVTLKGKQLNQALGKWLVEKDEDVTMYVVEGRHTQWESVAWANIRANGGYIKSWTWGGSGDRSVIGPYYNGTKDKNQPIVYFFKPNTRKKGRWCCCAVTQNRVEPLLSQKISWVRNTFWNYNEHSLHEKRRPKNKKKIASKLKEALSMY